MTSNPPKFGNIIDVVQKTTEKGSDITQDWGIRVLSTVSVHSDEYESRIFPFLLDFLKTCRSKDLPRHTERVTAAVNVDNRLTFIEMLEARKPALKTSQLKRVEKVIKQAQSL